MGKRARTTLIAVLVLLVAIQFWPVSRTNPPVTGEVQAPAEVMDVLQRSCYDCHSHTTVWPWYAHVAPMSWLVAHDVNEGRDHLDFSTWESLDAEHVGRALGHIVEQLEEKEMPLWYYLPLHPDARLSDADRELVITWAKARREALGLPGEPPRRGGPGARPD